MTNLAGKITAGVWAFTWCLMALCVLVGYGAVLESNQDLRLRSLKDGKAAEDTIESLTKSLRDTEAELEKLKQHVVSGEEAVNDVRNLRETVMLLAPNGSARMLSDKVKKIIDDFEIRSAGGKPEEL